MKKTLFLLTVLMIVACSKKQPDLTVKANIKGLKKGTLYLKKIEDTLFVTVDSLVINGNTNIQLHSDLDSPEMFFLHLDRNSSKKDFISFFAAKGVTEINTTLKNFSLAANIKGSKQQETLDKYKAIISKINNRKLDLMKEQFEAQKRGDTTKALNLTVKINNILKSKYLHTINFAVNNKNSEVAPYLALKEVFNAKINLLDTINNALTPKIKNSKYGKELELFITKIKAKNANP